MLGKVSEYLLRTPRVAAGFSLLLTAWYGLSWLKIALPEPGSATPLQLTYFHLEPVWAAILTLAYLPILKYASPLLLLLALTPPWVLAAISIATLILYRGKAIIEGLLWALLILETLALSENMASLLSLRTFGLVSYIEKALRLSVSTVSLPLIIALVLLGPFKYIDLLMNSEKIQKTNLLGEDLSKDNIYNLILALLLSLTVVSLPYLPTLNSSSKLVGIDPNVYYSEWISELKVSFTFNNPILRSRPLFIFLIYGLSQLVGVYWSMRIVQLLGFAAFTIASYYFTLSITDKNTAKLAALLFPLSYIAIILIYSGFYNNILASSFSLPAIVLLWKWIHNKNLKTLFLGILFFEIAIFMHPYSTLFYSIVIAGIAILEAFRFSKRSLILSFLATLFAVQSDLTSAGFGKESLMVIASAHAFPLTRYWCESLAFVVYNCAINAAVDIVNWLLAVKGLLSTNNSILISMAAVTGIAVLVAPLDGWMLKWRAIFSLPLPTYFAIALKSSSKRIKVLSIMLMANYCLGYIMNLNL